MAESWAPGLTDVARHIPSRTRDTRTPGLDKLLGTFTASTTPTDGQAQQVIDDTVEALLAVTGPLPAAGSMADEIRTAARVAVEWQAACDIEAAYPNREADLMLVDRLQARANAAKADLMRALAQTGAGLVDVATPYWGFPAPPGWGDTSPGSGADYVTRAVT